MDRYDINSELRLQAQDFIKGLFSALKKDDLYWKFRKPSGAAHGAMVSLDRDYLQGALHNVLETNRGRKSEEPSQESTGAIQGRYQNMEKWLPVLG